VAKEITPKEAKELLKKGAILLDVRTYKEFEEKHIEGSILIPLHELEKRITELLKYKNKLILCICRRGNRSKIACEILEKFGFNVYNIKGGITNW